MIMSCLACPMKMYLQCKLLSATGHHVTSPRRKKGELKEPVYILPKHYDFNIILLS